MSDGIYNYPFFPPHPQPTQTFVAPQVQQFEPPVSHGPKLICDYCEHEITQGEPALNGLYGLGGMGKRNGTPCVVEDADIPKGNFDVHYACFSSFILENLPEVADEIIAFRDEAYEDVPPEEVYCAACDAKLDPDVDDG